ncbi:hypothetical protein GCM10009801_35270 [Streptomyces albiaxialis]|uniref:Uncharacterized protein n=1 Tax=Streptomyces albiaxialis TaxID=329523 RepID=A0ABN2VZW6_9ACTN
MGWTVLYVAFGIVALWLLGEVLLQYKARLRWRLLAFGGFLGVVAGAVLGQVIVIGVGIAAFATGQTFVTLSYRRGFSTGWALGGSPGASRRRRGGPAARDAEPSLEVTGLEAGYDENGVPDYSAGQGAPTGPPAYDPGPGPGPGDTPPSGTPVPDFDYAGYQAAMAQEQTQVQSVYGDYAPPAPAAPPAQPVAYDDQQPYAPYQDPYGGYAQPAPQAPQYDYGYGDQGQSQGQGLSYEGYEGYPQGNGAGYGYETPGAPPTEPYYPDTPPGGVWVPQQREGGTPLPPEQPPAAPPYGYDEQQQYQNGYYGQGQGGY